MENEKPIEVQIAEIKAATPEAYIKGGDGVLIEIVLPHGCYTSASKSDEEDVWSIGWIEVPEVFRGHDIASKLLRSVTNLIKSKGGKVIEGEFTSVEGLKVRTKVFGKENVKLSVLHGDLLNIDEQECNFEEALKAIAQKKPVEGKTDLSSVDMENWEMPTLKTEEKV